VPVRSGGPATGSGPIPVGRFLPAGKPPPDSALRCRWFVPRGHARRWGVRVARGRAGRTRAAAGAVPAASASRRRAWPSVGRAEQRQRRASLADPPDRGVLLVADAPERVEHRVLVDGDVDDAAVERARLDQDPFRRVFDGLGDRPGGRPRPPLQRVAAQRRAGRRVALGRRPSVTVLMVLGAGLLAVFWLGVYPAPLLDTIDAASKALLP